MREAQGHTRLILKSKPGGFGAGFDWGGLDHTREVEALECLADAIIDAVVDACIFHIFVCIVECLLANYYDTTTALIALHAGRKMRTQNSTSSGLQPG